MVDTQLQSIYNSLPKIQCKGKCQQSCGPIAFFPVEVSNLQSAQQPVPAIAQHPKWGDFTCTALDSDGRCCIYDNRPIICRLFGLVKRLRCPFGCEPERWVPDAEARRLMAKVQALKEGEAHFTLNEPSRKKSAIEL